MQAFTLNATDEALADLFDSWIDSEISDKKYKASLESKENYSSDTASYKYAVKYATSKSNRDDGVFSYSMHKTFKEAKDELLQIINLGCAISGEVIIETEDEEVILFGNFPEKKVY